MAPFIFDDGRRSLQLHHADSANPAHIADAPPADLPSMQGAPAPGAADRAEDISIALEWKLLLPLLAPGQEDPRPDDARPIVQACGSSEQARLEQAHECVAQTIRAAGEQAVTMHSLVKEGMEEKEVWASGWVVKRANSAEPLADEKAVDKYVWVPVEICSPKMRFQDGRTQARVRTVLDALNAAHRLVANCSCEVHVHLGRMDGRAWTLPTLKRLASLLWVAEPALRSIRDPGSPNFDNVYTWGFAMRQRSRLAMRLETSPAMPNASSAIPDVQIASTVQGSPPAVSKDVEALAAIWKTATHLELGQLLSGPEKMYRRLGFNFSAFGEEDERARRNPRTMEFRMMDGTLDTGLIAGWLAICGTIVETAVVDADPRFGAAIGLLLHTSGSASEASNGETPSAGDRLGRAFGGLMQALGIEELHYRGFEEKIRREH